MSEFRANFGAKFHSNPQPNFARLEWSTIEYQRRIATALVTGRKACPAGRSECSHDWRCCLRAAEAAAHGVWDSNSLQELAPSCVCMGPDTSTVVSSVRQAACERQGTVARAACGQAATACLAARGVQAVS